MVDDRVLLSVREPRAPLLHVLMPPVRAVAVVVVVAVIAIPAVIRGRVAVAVMLLPETLEGITATGPPAHGNS